MKTKKWTRGAATAYWQSWLPSSQEGLITRDHDRPMKTLVQKMNLSISNTVKIMVSEDFRYNLMLWGEVTHVGGKQEDAGLNQRELPGGVDKEIRPLSSPVYSLLDYFVCGVSQLLVSAKSHNKIQNLIQKMRALMGSLDRDTVAKACLKFRSWIEAVIGGDSNFIEYLDSKYVPLLISF
jgi:hypothetical protein